VSSSQTVVKKVRGGSNPEFHRYTLISEIALSDGSFVFLPSGVEMTLGELCDALVAQGVCEADIIALLTEAIASFDRR
jgi:hypothetical protein